jgi:hypothetical protein
MYPNNKVILVNEDNGGYEIGDDADPYGSDDEGVDAYVDASPIIVVSSRTLSVEPNVDSRRCNLFQTKALVGPNKACKVIIDGGNCRNLASKELCAKLGLKYLPHPNPYYIQWLSYNGEMKVNHMVHVNFEIGSYKDSIDFDVVPMMIVTSCWVGHGSLTAMCITIVEPIHTTWSSRARKSTYILYHHNKLLMNLVRRLK